MKFEYLTKRLWPTSELILDSECLSRLGNDGWELVVCYKDCFVFKREKTNDDLDLALKECLSEEQLVYANS